MRFADKSQHQIFVEPEGLHSNELYPNGISTSLPYDVQLQFVRSIVGFENAHITRPGYAIEYDYFDPRDLEHSLETRLMEGLFFAGQINGTTGYEEAAAQGLLAGTNAALKVAGKPAWYPKRNEAYIGVLVDDLINQGTDEPYRMFTSRAEFRLILRQDNADARLSQMGRELGLVKDERWAVFTAKKKQLETLGEQLLQTRVIPGSDIARRLEKSAGIKVSKDTDLHSLLKRPEVEARDVLNIVDKPELEADWGAAGDRSKVCRLHKASTDRDRPYRQTRAI